MLTKWVLVNVPEGGVDHLVESRRYSINDKLTDNDAEKLIKHGLEKYFQAVQTTDQHGNQTNPINANTIGSQPADSTNTIGNQSADSTNAGRVASAKRTRRNKNAGKLGIG